MKKQKFLTLGLIICIVLISGCTSSNDTSSTVADPAGFNSEFETFWTDVVTSTQTEHNYQLFLGYKIDSHNNLIISTTNSWFNLKSHEQHQLLDMIGKVYNGMRVKYGLTEGNVILKDNIGSEICRYTVWGNIKCSY